LEIGEKSAALTRTYFAVQVKVLVSKRKVDFEGRGLVQFLERSEMRFFEDDFLAMFSPWR